MSAARAVQGRVLARTRGGFRPSARWETVPALVGRVRPGALARLERDPEVRRIDLDGGGGRVGDVESLHLIGADAVQATGLTGRGVTVAIIDSGIDRTHPDLSTSLAGEHCVVPPGGCPGGVAQADGP